MSYYISVDLLFQNHSDLRMLETSDISWLSLLTTEGMLSAKREKSIPPFSV